MVEAAEKHWPRKGKEGGVSGVRKRKSRLFKAKLRPQKSCKRGEELERPSAFLLPNNSKQCALILKDSFRHICGFSIVFHVLKCVLQHTFLKKNCCF